MSEKHSETQALMFQKLDAMNVKLDAMNDKVDEIKVDTKDYIVTKKLVEQHEGHHKLHFAAIDKIKTDVNKAKGWGAALGAVGGAIVGVFKH